MFFRRSGQSAHHPKALEADQEKLVKMSLIPANFGDENTAVQVVGNVVESEIETNEEQTSSKVKDITTHIQLQTLPTLNLTKKNLCDNYPSTTKIKNANVVLKRVTGAERIAFFFEHFYCFFSKFAAFCSTKKLFARKFFRFLFRAILQNLIYANFLRHVLKILVDMFAYF